MGEFPRVPRQYERDEHWENIKNHDGKIPGLTLKDYELLKIPKGFVVNGELSQEMIDKIKILAYPFKLTADPNTQAASIQKKAEEDLGTSDLMFFALPNEEDGWKFGPVILKDLDTKNPENLLTDADKAINAGNLDVATSKQLAYALITGDK